MTTDIIIDFDSTFVNVEALDELARIALRGQPNQAEVVAQIEQITRAGMEGKVGFGESLKQRLALFEVRREHLAELVELLRARVTPSLVVQRDFIAGNADRIYIISGGFKEYIVPVVAEFGVAADHVLANTFTWSEAGVVTGCDVTNPMSQDGGKVLQLYEMALEGRVIMIGDGHSDLQTRAAGAADSFVAFVENERRDGVVAEADYIAKSFHDVVGFCS